MQGKSGLRKEESGPHLTPLLQLVIAALMARPKGQFRSHAGLGQQWKYVLHYDAWTGNIVDKVYNVIPFQQLQYRRVTPTMALRSTKQRAITALIGKKQGWSVQGHWEQRALEAIEIKKNKSSMNLDRGLHLPLVWNPVLGLTWPLIPYFTICSTPRPMSCMFLLSFHLKPLLNYIRPIFNQSHIPQLLLPFLYQSFATSAAS